MATKDNDMSFASPPLIDDATLDQLMAQIDAKGLELLGPEGVLTELTSAIMNRAMQTELTHHMGYEPGDPAGWGSGNNRNGSSAKTVLTDAGSIPVMVPRDRRRDIRTETNSSAPSPVKWVQRFDHLLDCAGDDHS